MPDIIDVPVPTDLKITSMAYGDFQLDIYLAGARVELTTEMSFPP
jgi:hypothetical protein